MNLNVPCYKDHQQLLPFASRRSGTTFVESRSRCWHLGSPDGLQPSGLPSRGNEIAAGVCVATRLEKWTINSMTTSGAPIARMILELSG